MSLQNTFRYCHLKIRASRLPGLLRVDPLAVVYTGGSGKWDEVGVTECRLNEFNPQFAIPIELPVDSTQQLNTEVRVDFYNKQRVDSRFLGTCNTYLSTVYSENGGEVELAFETPNGTSSKTRVYLKVAEGYNIPSSDGEGQVKISFQLSQTNYWGVSMKTYYEICVGENANWTPVFQSAHAKLDQQGWGQFADAVISLRHLVRDELHLPLLFSLYRHKVIGSRKLLGTFQASLKELARKSVGDLITYNANPAEDILSADVLVTHAEKTGVSYAFGLKLVNVHWRAQEIQDDNTLE